MRQSQRAVSAAMIIAGVVAVLAPTGASAAAGANTVYESAATAFGPLTGSGNCSSSNTNQRPSRELADTLDDDWFASTGYNELSLALFPDADAGSITPAGSEYLLAMPNTSVSIGLTYMSVPNGTGTPGDAPWDTDVRASTANSSWGVPAAAGDPTLLYNTQEQMQDCAVKPLSLVSPSEGGTYAGNTNGTLYWNGAAFGGSAERTSSDSVLIRFSEPVDNFGAWFGDLETRTDGHGQPAYVKLYGADGQVISIEQIDPATPRAITTPGVSDAAGPDDPAFDDGGFGCGDQHQSNNEAAAPNNIGDYSACGNHGTRFIGFTRIAKDIGYMQVIVGDDDHCVEVVSQCDSNTEHLSLIGPSMAVGPARVTIDKQVTNDSGGTADAGEFSFELVADPGGSAEETTTHVAGDRIDLEIGVEYRLNEVAHDGYDLTDVTCTSDADPAQEFDPASFTPLLLNFAGTCVFVNNDIAVPTSTTTTTTAAPTTTVPSTIPLTSAPAVTNPLGPTSDVASNGAGDAPDAPAAALALTGPDVTSLLIAGVALLLLGIAARLGLATRQLPR